MRGTETKQASMLCLTSPETVVPLDHPIRRIKELADAALAELAGLRRDVRHTCDLPGFSGPIVSTKLARSGLIPNPCTFS